MISKNTIRLYVIFVAFGVILVGLEPSTRKATGQQDAGFKVWVKTSPCSASRTDWMTVAKEYPGAAGGPDFWSLADLIQTPSACTTQNSQCSFKDAMTSADSLRTHVNFNNYCCKDYSVWENTTTGETAIVRGAGSAGFGWRQTDSGLCCEEAEAVTGKTGLCSQSVRNPYNCFASDAGMGSTNRDEHLQWARQQSPETLQSNLLTKIDLVFVCKNITDIDFANFFADVSVLIAKYVQNVGCFGNDAGAVIIDRSAHYEWARTQTRQRVHQNLQGKVRAAFRCLNSTGQINLFTDAAIPAAKISQSSPITAGGPRATPIPRTYSSPTPTPIATPSALPPGTRPCDAAERTAFARMLGAFQTPSGAKITIGGSCEQASGTEIHTDYCENPDAIYNQTLKRYQVSFTGRMGGSFLMVQWKNPSDPRRLEGSASCYIGADGILSCSGFPCRIDGVRK